MLIKAIETHRAGRTSEARVMYQRILRRRPQDPDRWARHMYAAATGESFPERANDEYVRTTFDEFADSFDENLSDLGHRAPQLVADAVTRHRPARELERRDVHAPGYVEATVRGARLQPLEMTEVVLRSELGTGVRGLLVAAAPSD